MSQLFKTIIISFIFVLSIFSTVYSQNVKQYSISNLDIEKYIKLNEEEKRLIDYKDDENALRLKLNQLAHINKSREKHRQEPVALDILASRVANKISKEGAQKNFMGHFNPKGETPYHRYAFAGGTDHISENASALSSTQTLPSLPKDISAYIQQAHNAFMDERAPNDGHKQNCIDPSHNFVGLGYYIHHDQFRYYEEFIDRYLTFGNFKNQVIPNETFNIPVKPKSNKHLHMILVYYEKFPSKMSTSTINKKMKYDDYTKDLSSRILPWELPKPNNHGYTDLEFKFKKQGLYYIQIYLDNKPFTSGHASTENKIQASGVVIQVK